MTPMNKYKLICKKGVFTLTVQGKQEQQLAEREVFALQNGEFPALLPLNILKKRNTFQLIYSANGLVLLQDYLSETVDKIRFSRLLNSILRSTRNVENAVFNPASLLLDPDYLFVDPESGEAKLVYIPIAAYDCETSLRNLLQKFLQYCHFDANADTSYIQRFIEILNDGAAFSVFSIEQYVDNLIKEVAASQKPKQCPICGQISSPEFCFCPDCGAGLTAVNENGKAPFAGKTCLFQESTGKRMVINDLICIGKSSSNDLCLANIGTVSRFHARIQRAGARWYITDLESTNGTFVNEQMLRSGTQTEIHNGDRIRLANESFIFEIK